MPSPPPNRLETIDGIVCEEISGFIDTADCTEYVVYYRRGTDDYMTVGSDGSKLIGPDLDAVFEVRASTEGDRDDG